MNDEEGREREVRRKSQFTKTYKDSVNLVFFNPPASFLCFGTQIYHTLSTTECWVGFRAKQAPVMDVGKAEAKDETE